MILEEGIFLGVTLLAELIHLCLSLGYLRLGAFLLAHDVPVRIDLVIPFLVEGLIVLIYGGILAVRLYDGLFARLLQECLYVDVGILEHEVCHAQSLGSTFMRRYEETYGGTFEVAMKLKLAVLYHSRVGWHDGKETLHVADVDSVAVDSTLSTTSDYISSFVCTGRHGKHQHG